MVTEMGSGVGSEGDMDNSFIRSAVGSSGPVCTISIRVGGAGVLVSNACLSSSSSSLTTSSTTVLTSTSLCVGAVPALCILGEQGSSGPAGTSSSRVGSDGPGWSSLVGICVVASFPHLVRLGI